MHTIYLFMDIEQAAHIALLTNTDGATQSVPKIETTDDRQRDRQVSRKLAQIHYFTLLFGGTEGNSISSDCACLLHYLDCQRKSAVISFCPLTLARVIRKVDCRGCTNRGSPTIHRKCLKHKFGFFNIPMKLSNV